MRFFSIALGLVVLLAGIGLIGGAGCNKTAAAGSGALIQKREEINPAAKPGEGATLVLAGTKYDVTLTSSRQGADVTLTLNAFGEKFEEEVYADLPTQFGLRAAAGERYDPAIPLLKFPMKVGDTWTWKGKLFHGDQNDNATATITTAPDTLSMKGTSQDVIRVEVNFKIENGTQNPAQRRLSFWFLQNKGVIKRDFGGASSREPSEG